MNKKQVPIKILNNGEGLQLPFYATSGSAGMDLLAAISDDIIIKPGERKLISTGLSVALPEGYEMQIRPRSGLALENGITLVNSPGTIDADYRGEVGIILINHGNEDFIVSRGLRIAQAIISVILQIEWQQVDSLNDTHRSSGGFGSTGLR